MYRFRKVLVLFLSLFLLGMLSGCSKSVDDSETLNVVLGPEPANLDPALSLTIDIRSYLSHIFEGLTILDEEGNVRPGVAESWTSNEDNTEFIFVLREDAMWTDGRKVNADDFKYAWLRVLNPDTASGWASFLYYIKGAEQYNQGFTDESTVGITVTQDGQLVVELENPCSFFASMVAMQPYYPVRQDIIEENGDNWTFEADLIVSNGAYKVKEWNHDESILLTKSDTYWDDLASGFETITFLLAEDSSAVMNIFETGQADFVEKVLTSGEMEQVATVQTCDFTVTKFLSINAKREALSDRRVREAISIALDRNIIADLMGEGYTALCAWVPVGFTNTDTGEDFKSEVASSTYVLPTSDLERAKELMSEAGYPNGEGFPTIEYLTNTSSLNVKLAEIVKEQLAKIGININVITYESKVFNEYRMNRDFDIVAASWAAEYPDISSYFYGFQSNDINNYASYNNELYDKLFTESLALTNMSDRYKCYHQLEDLIMDSWYIIPLYAENTSFIAKDNLDGYIHDVTGCLNFNCAIRK